MQLLYDDGAYFVIDDDSVTPVQHLMELNVGWEGYFLSPDGDVFSRRTVGSVRKLKTQLTGQGHKTINLRANGTSSTHMVSRLMYQLYLDGLEDYQWVSYLDGNPMNVTLENLYITTPKERLNQSNTHETIHH